MKLFVFSLGFATAVLAAASSDTTSSTAQACGSRGMPPCPAGQQCVDNPTPSCPDGLATDCPGKCKNIEGSFCGGFANIQCPSGYDCVDNPNDGCDPKKGGADCGGICKATKQCGGFVGKPCAPGYYCYNSTPNCADCFGKCIKEGGSCGGKTGKKCPKPLVCSDKPNDGCDPAKGAKDCPQVCVAPS